MSDNVITGTTGTIIPEPEMAGTIVVEPGTTSNIDPQAQQTQPVDGSQIQKLTERLDKIQRNFDKVNTEKSKLAKELDETRQKNMSADEWKQQKQKEYEDSLSEKEHRLEKMELDFEKTQMLNKNSFDTDLIDLIQGSDIDTFTINVSKLNDRINAMVEKKVNERFASSNPAPGTSNNQNSGNEFYTIDEMRNMKRDEIGKNMEKYEKSMNHYNNGGK